MGELPDTFDHVIVAVHGIGQKKCSACVHAAVLNSFVIGAPERFRTRCDMRPTR